jgi:hypothetical protein
MTNAPADADPQAPGDAALIAQLVAVEYVAADSLPTTANPVALIVAAN